MTVTQNVVMERGLLRVVARQLSTISQGHDNRDISYDVEIRGQEVLHSFTSLEEATQFVDMVAPNEKR